jgi:hypothetical protein
MVNRVTINLPTPLAETIAVLAAEQLRPPRDQIIWLLRDAVRRATEAIEKPQLNTPADRRRACVGNE